MKKIIVIFFIALCVVMLLYWALKSNNLGSGEPVQSSPSPTPPLSLYRGIVPGISTSNDAITSLGQPLRKDESTAGATLVYSSGIDNQPVNIDVTKNGVIYCIEEPVESTVRYDNLTKNLGPPDLVLYGLLERQGFRLFVFLDKGVAFLANPQTQEVRERWYFPQTDASSFRQIIAPNLSPNSTLGQE